MNIAIASGKGGTGKTTVAVNLAAFLGGTGERVRYLDCDVEEPNGHLFLKPRIQDSRAVSIAVPVIDESKCTACGECVRFCAYKALIRLGNTAMLFPELCHGCGGCTLLCPRHAITEGEKRIGYVETGTSESLAFVHGLLDIGEAMSPPLVREVVSGASADSINIIDAPPGTSCPVIASVRNADFIALVTEPTPFGLNDLGLALDMVRELGAPHGVIVNRSEKGNSDAEAFCKKRQAPIITHIPDDRLVAEAYSRGEMILAAVPQFRQTMTALWQSIRKQVRQ